ncbi:MAG TPA: class I SAM-dependent methyltransferase [Acidimicrobiia bacterium]
MSDDVANHDIAPDGSPVAVFAALPARGVPEMLHTQMLEGDSVLELACGAGRYTGGLVDLGHPVVAVDESAAMLAHVDERAERVQADVYALDLRRRFDTVVAASYLVNSWPPLLLAACARHAEPDGAVIVQRYAPDWARNAEPGEAEVGSVTIRFEKVECVDDRLVGDVAYLLGDHSWHQHVDAQVLDDAELARYANYAGLAFDAVIDEFGEWVRLLPQ